jgi:hypothetical protein
MFGTAWPGGRSNSSEYAPANDSRSLSINQAG